LTGGNGQPAIRSNAILPTLQIIASNGITTPIRAIFERAVAHKKFFQAYLNLMSLHQWLAFNLCTYLLKNL